MATKLYEASRQESFAKTVKKQDQDWVQNANDVQCDDDDDEHNSDEDMDFDDDEEDEKDDVLVTPPRAARANE